MFQCVWQLHGIHLFGSFLTSRSDGIFPSNNPEKLAEWEKVDDTPALLRRLCKLKDFLS